MLGSVPTFRRIVVLLQNAVLTTQKTEFNDTANDVTSLSRACYMTSPPQNPWSNHQKYSVRVNTVKIAVTYFFRPRVKNSGNR